MSEEMPQGKETVSDEEIIKAIDEHQDPFLAASEVSDMFDHTRQWAHIRLESLNEEGAVRKKESSRQSVIWWVD